MTMSILFSPKKPLAPASSAADAGPSEPASATSTAKKRRKGGGTTTTPPSSSAPREGNGSVQVCVRMRPLGDCGRVAAAWRVDPSDGSVHELCRNTGARDPTRGCATLYRFAARRGAYGGTSTNADVYDGAARGVVSAVLGGECDGTVMAYGQTASGKTYTMQGDGLSTGRETTGGGSDGDCSGGERGIIQMAVIDVFEHIHRERSGGKSFAVHASLVEVYNEKVYDLLSQSKAVVEVASGGEIRGCTRTVVTCVEDALRVLREGERKRSVGSTEMNERSSRSHAIFRLSVECTDEATGVATVTTLSLVDLAGSESARRTGATGERRREGGKINQSLNDLGMVVRELARQRRSGRAEHVNYRNSKLTKILQSSLSGCGRTAIICCASPSSEHLETTKSTLQFAESAQLIKTNASKPRQSIFNLSTPSRMIAKRTSFAGNTGGERPRTSLRCPRTEGMPRTKRTAFMHSSSNKILEDSGGEERAELRRLVEKKNEDMRALEARLLFTKSELQSAKQKLELQSQENERLESQVCALTEAISSKDAQVEKLEKDHEDDVQQIDEWHKGELDRVRYEMDEKISETITSKNEEIGHLSFKLRLASSDLLRVREELEQQHAADIQKVVNDLKESHCAEIESAKTDMTAAHKVEMMQLRSEMDTRREEELKLLRAELESSIASAPSKRRTKKKASKPLTPTTRHNVRLSARNKRQTDFLSPSKPAARTMASKTLNLSREVPAEFGQVGWKFTKYFGSRYGTYEGIIDEILPDGEVKVSYPADPNGWEILTLEKLRESTREKKKISTKANNGNSKVSDEKAGVVAPHIFRVGDKCWAYNRCRDEMEEAHIEERIDDANATIRWIKEDHLTKKTYCVCKLIKDLYTHPPDDDGSPNGLEPKTRQRKTRSSSSVLRNDCVEAGDLSVHREKLMMKAKEESQQVVAGKIAQGEEALWLNEATCHICHKKESVLTFPCGKHSYCDRLCNERLGFSLCDYDPANPTILPIDHCPVCSLSCKCSKCKRKLDAQAVKLKECCANEQAL